MTDLARELRLATRSLSRRPAFVSAVVLTLALGIGANAAIFSAVDAFLLRPLPFRDAERLVRIESVRGGTGGPISYREVQDLRDLRDVFVDVAAYTDQGQYNASGDGRPEELVSTITTQNLFRVLGVVPVLGRPWPEVLDYTRDFKVMISHRLWQRRFGGAPDVVGRTMTLDGAEGYEIVGVLPAGFAFPSRAELYRSNGIAANPARYHDRGDRGRWGIARLHPDVTLEQARARVNAVATRLTRDHPVTNAGVGFHLVPLADIYVGDVRPYLLLLLGAVGLVLLIACTNAASLLLSYLHGRDRELALRTALGASAADVVRMLLAECLVLATAACVVGTALGLAGLQLIERLVRVDLPIWMSVGMSWQAFAFTAIVSVIAGLLSGVLPAWRAVRRRSLVDALKEGSPASGEGRGRRNLQSALVVAEMAIAVMLLLGAGLMVRSFREISQVDPGFDPDSLLTYRVELGWRAYPDLPSAVRFRRELLARLADVPGVRMAATTSRLPFDDISSLDNEFMLEGQDAAARERNPYLRRASVSERYFEAMRIPLRLGRGFTPHDRDSMPRVAVVSASAAARIWPDRSPVGERLRIGGGGAPLATLDTIAAPWVTVVGVVGDVRHDLPTSRRTLDVYLHDAQWSVNGSYVVIRADPGSRSVRQGVTEAVWKVDPNQSFFDVKSMIDRITDRTWVPRLSGAVFGAFSTLAAVLAAVGSYSVLAFAVSRRRRDIGVCRALGASSRLIWREVVWEGLRLALSGGAAGLVLGTLLAQGLSRFLYGVTPLDAPTLSGVLVALLAVAGTASWIPAWRATRIDPLDALRSN